jgi:phosphoglycerol transferase
MAIENQALSESVMLKGRIWDKSRLKALGAYLGTIVLSLLILTWVMKLHQADWRVPFAYHGDSLFYHLVVKGTLDHGWLLDNSSLGAPEGLNLRDVPTSDHNFYFLLIKLLGFLTADYALVLNLFFVLSFPLTVICSLAVWRHFGLSWLPAILGSLLYTFLPFHFTRGQHHLFLSAYYVVPLTVLVVLWVCSEKLWRESKEQGWLRANLRDHKFIISLLICVLVASSGTYYAFFACFLLLVAGINVTLRRKDARGLLLPSLLIAVITVGLMANLLPSLIHIYQHGSAPVVRRLPAEAEVYGLKIGQLLMPLTGHRVAALAELKNEYNMRLLVNENDDATLGLVGSFGFLFLIGWLFYRKPEAARLNAPGPEGFFNHLSILTIAAVLLGTIGGFGSLFAFFISPQIRAYNRISIFIAFFSLFAVLLLLERLARRFASLRWQQMAFGSLIALVLAVGLWDQRSHRFIPNYAQAQAEYRNDAEFVSRIESTLPRRAMIFQLPVILFPENPKVNRMNDYDLGKAYLHSTHLRWSYGTIKGREGEVWQKMTASKPASEMVEMLSLAGFGGLYLDRFGYADNGAKLEAELSAALEAKPLVSKNERLVFFDLTAYQQKLKERYPASAWEAKQEAAAHPLMAVWQRGFSDLEGTAENNWRWGAAESQMQLVNRTRREQRVKLEMSFAAGSQANLRIESPFFAEQLVVNKPESVFSRMIALPPGSHTFRFTCDARRILTPNDFRDLVFRVHNFKLTVED